MERQEVKDGVSDTILFFLPYTQKLLNNLKDTHLQYQNTIKIIFIRVKKYSDYECAMTSYRILQVI